MKLKSGIFILLLAGLVASAQTNKLTSLLQQGLFEEQANRNLDAAIADYQSLATQFDQDRPMAATAVFRLGECYRAQGKTNEAAAQYQRILRDFSDQATLATLSRQDLAGMGARPEPAVSDAGQQQKELLAKQITLAEQDLADTQKLVQVGKALPTEVRAAEREVLRLRQQLAALDSGRRAELLDLSVPVKSEEDQEIERIEKLLQTSPDLINKADNSGNTLLSKATVQGQTKVVNYLLDHGAEVDAGFPALSQAARAGNRAMVALLLDRGANVNNPSEYGRTALTMAAEQGFASVVEILLAHKADPNAVDSRNGRTALYSTLMQGQEKCVRQLIAAGAQVNSEAEDGTTALSLVAERGWTEVAKMLLEAKADPNAGKKNQPLLAAIASKNLELVELLLKAGANPNMAGSVNFVDARVKTDANYLNHKGRLTPLWFAIYQNQPALVQLLLKYKADPNDSQTDGQSVLFQALADTNLLAALLEHGANPNVATGDNRYSPLMNAASMGNAEIVALLLQHQANPNLTDSNGDVALLFAIRKHSPATVRVLLAGGANPDAQTANGSANGYPMLVIAVTDTGNKEVLTALIEAKANVNLPDPDGKTALHWAADKDRKDLIELLVKAGADVNVRTKIGATPLDYAKSHPPTVGITVGVQPGGSAGVTVVTNGLTTADLLRQSGALDELPDFTRIRITRQGLSQPVEVFRKGATLTNQFTLLETVMRFYSFQSVYIPGADNREAWVGLPFPDFGRIIIRRPSPKIGGKEQEIKVSLLNSSNVVDCVKDVSVQFGDVIEIPESVHALNARMPNPVKQMETTRPLSPGATDVERIEHLQATTTAQANGGMITYQNTSPCLQKSVQLVVAGEPTTFKVNSWKEGFLSQALGKTEARSVLRSSSDLSRVKVTRKTGKSAKPAVFTVNVSDSAQRSDDLWLQDGDVIEVPEKP
jgi:ankyrin repeat protein